MLKKLLNRTAVAVLLQHLGQSFACWGVALTCQNVNAISLAVGTPISYLRANLSPVVNALYSWVPCHNLVVVISSMMGNLRRDKWRLGGNWLLALTV